MSLWYDIKNKIYSSGPMDNWYVGYMQRCCKVLTEAVTSIYSNHISGLTGRHNCKDIEYSDGITLNTALENMTKERDELLSAKVDKEDGKQLTSNDYTDTDKTAVEKSAGKKTYGDTFSIVKRSSDGDILIEATSEKCKTGSEIFNDYNYNQAKGLFSHSEGQYTSAVGDFSHAQGFLTKADGICAHAEGENTYATGKHQHVQGILNIEDTSNEYAHIVGNGYYETDSDNNEIPVRQNAHTLDWKGNAWYAGDVVCGNSKTGLQEQIIDLYNLRPTVLTEVSDTLNLNTIYDLGQCETLSLNIPDGNVGDWIKVDFISGETPTELLITAKNICDFSITPEPNTSYSLIFDWGRLTSDAYGWRFSYSEYTKVVTE